MQHELLLSHIVLHALKMSPFGHQVIWNHGLTQALWQSHVFIFFSVRTNGHWPPVFKLRLWRKSHHGASNDQHYQGLAHKGHVSIKESHRASNSELAACGPKEDLGTASHPFPPLPVPQHRSSSDSEDFKFKAARLLASASFACLCRSLSALCFHFPLKKGHPLLHLWKHSGLEANFWHSRGSVKLLSKWTCQAAMVYKQTRNNLLKPFSRFIYLFFGGEGRVCGTTTCMKVRGQLVRVLFPIH